MTKAEWLACIDPARMLEAVAPNTPERNTLARRWLVWIGFGADRPAYQASERQVWLFNAACARRIWARLDEPHRLAVEAIERCVDGDEMRDAAIAGADCCTIPPAVFRGMYKHALTDAGLEAFLADWKKAGQTIL